MYEFHEDAGGPGLNGIVAVWTYRIRIHADGHGGMVADLAVDGFQTMVRAHCRASVAADGGALTLSYLSEDGGLGPLGKPGDTLLRLERLKNEALEIGFVRWITLRANNPDRESDTLYFKTTAKPSSAANWADQ